jgi:SAM-dependent MidA family methyltransferase
VHVSPLFAELLARQIRECFAYLGEASTVLTPGERGLIDRHPSDVNMVVDLGAGDGTLARALASDFAVVAVERSDAARALLAPIPAVASIEELEPFTGVVIANELFDNVPFHRIRARNDRPHEVFVALEGDRFIELEADSSIDAPLPRSDEERTISPHSIEIVRALAKVLIKGYVFIFDYGYIATEQSEPIRSYAAHRMHEDVLSDPGTKDITGPVDFDALADAARSAGFDVHGPVTQRDALMNLGYRELLEHIRARQHEAETKNEWRDAIATFGARGDASMLVDPTGLGTLKVMAFATPGLPPPRALQSRV